MTWPLQEKFLSRGPITQVPREWFETVAKILNHLRGVNCDVDKTAEPSEMAPWAIKVPTPESPEAGEGLPSHDAATDGKYLRSTGETPPIWETPDTFPEHDAGTDKKVIRSVGSGTPVWDWVRPDNCQSITGPADLADANVPLATSYQAADGRPYFFSRTPRKLLAEYVKASINSGVPRRGDWLVLDNDGAGGLEAKWWTASLIYNAGGGNAGLIGVWVDGYRQSGDSLANLLRDKVSASGSAPLHLKRAADGTVTWANLCTNTPTNGQLAMWVVSGGQVQLHASTVDAAAIPTVANPAAGDMLYYNNGAWQKLSAIGKSRYMVLQLTADNGLPTWDWLRAY